MITPLTFYGQANDQHQRYSTPQPSDEHLQTVRSSAVSGVVQNREQAEGMVVSLDTMI
jgi:hypothetical protein